MAAINGRIVPLLSLRRVCHLECYRPLPRQGRLPRDLRLNPEAEEWLPPALRERGRHLREMQFYRDYQAPLTAGAPLG